MFKTPKNNVIESDEGFRVEILGQTGLRYYDGDKELFVDSEVLAGPAGVVVYSNSILHWAGDAQELKENEKLKIIDNLKRAFRHIGFEIQIV